MLDKKELKVNHQRLVKFKKIFTETFNFLREVHAEDAI
jgi:hypothetical protein